MIKLVRWREFLWLLLWNTDDKFGVQNYYDLSFSERKKSVLREWEESEQRRDVIPFISLKFPPNQAIVWGAGVSFILTVITSNFHLF